MTRDFQMVCLLAISCVALWSAGCSSKAVKSDGTSTRSAPTGPVPSLSMTDPDGTERLNSGIAVAKALLKIG